MSHLRSCNQKIFGIFALKQTTDSINWLSQQLQIESLTYCPKIGEKHPFKMLRKKKKKFEPPNPRQLSKLRKTVWSDRKLLKSHWAAVKIFICVCVCAWTGLLNTTQNQSQGSVLKWSTVNTTDPSVDLTVFRYSGSFRRRPCVSVMVAFCSNLKLNLCVPLLQKKQNNNNKKTPLNCDDFWGGVTDCVD